MTGRDHSASKPEPAGETNEEAAPGAAPEPGDPYDAFTVRTAEHVAVVEMRGTGRGNALGKAVWEELPAVFGALGDDAAVRAVVLRGAGDAFSVGLDLRWFAPHFRHVMRRGEGLAEARGILLSEASWMQRAVNAVARCKKPVIAAVDGLCIGGGLDLAAACDVRLASSGAVFSLREVRLGIVADLGVLQRLPQIVGQGHTRELALTGKDIDADRALEIGLVNSVFETPEQLHAAAYEMAREIAANPPRAVEGSKAVLEQAEAAAVEAGLREAAMWNVAFMPSHDTTEALKAWMEGRRPDFTGG